MKFMNPKDIEARFDTLKGERSNWENLWQEIADLMLPRKNTFMTKRTEGEERNVQIFDNTGMQSLELFAAALHSFLTNPNSLWFELTTGDDNLDNRDDVRKFLQEETRQMHNMINNSNFQTEVHELYLDIGGFGTAVQSIEEDDTYGVRFSTKFLGDYCVCENHLGMVDEIYGEFEWTARQIVSMYGLNAVNDKVKECYEKNRDDKFKIIFCVYPKTYDPETKMGFPFIAQHILRGHNHVLKKEGFHEFPYVVPRFSKASGEKYGRSPAMNALAEVKVLNVMTETTLEGAQKVVDPPLQAPDDGFMMQLNTYPGGISYYRAGGQDIIRPVFNDVRIDFGFQVIELHQSKVRDAFYVNQFSLGEGPSSVARTATEVMQRTEENFRLLGPMMGRMQTEFLRPTVDRVFAIRLRKGLVKNIPKILSGRKLDVRYSSFIAIAQRSEEANSIMRFMQAAGPFFQADPSTLQLIDAQGALTRLARSYGTSQEIFRDQEEVEEIRRVQQDAMRKQAEMQNNQATADVAAKVIPIAQASSNVR